MRGDLRWMSCDDKLSTMLYIVRVSPHAEARCAITINSKAQYPVQNKMGSDELPC